MEGPYRMTFELVNQSQVYDILVGIPALIVYCRIWTIHWKVEHAEFWDMLEIVVPPPSGMVNYLQSFLLRSTMIFLDSNRYVSVKSGGPVSSAKETATVVSQYAKSNGLALGPERLAIKRGTEQTYSFKNQSFQHCSWLCLFLILLVFWILTDMLLGWFIIWCYLRLNLGLGVQGRRTEQSFIPERVCRRTYQWSFCRTGYQFQPACL